MTGSFLMNMLDKAILDIGTKAIAMFNDAKSDEWKETTFKASYEDPNGKDGPFETCAAVIYTKTTLTEDGKTGDHIVLYYLAVGVDPFIASSTFFESRI